MRQTMDDDVESANNNDNDNNNNIVVTNSSPTTKWLTKIPKNVILLSIVVITCTIVYFASYNNSNLFRPNRSFSLSVNIEYNELRKVLKEASTKEKTVILTTLNEAWATPPNSIFDIFLESFKIGKNTSRLLNHLLVIAVDEKAYARCQATVSHCYLFKGNRSSEMAHEAKFMSPIYLDMMWERLALLKTILSLGFNFVFTDTDIMWFRDPFLHFDSNVDFQTSCDHFNGNAYDLNNLPNNGFNFVRSNKRTIKFYEFWVSSRSKYPGLNEQNVFDKIKHNPFVKKLGLKIKFLDTNYFGGFCERSKDFNKVCTMHANCCVGLDLKIADLITMLGDWEKFVSLPTNQTTPEYHWSIPNKCHM